MITKSTVLSILRSLLAKRTLVLDGLWEFSGWKALWQEAFDYVMRTKKYGALATENVLSGHVTLIIEFLHAARRYTTSPNVMDDIVNTAMQHLQDTRSPGCLQGLVLLLACLPTRYPHYGAIFHQWVQIWDEIDRNPYWDACWLTLLTRARKSLLVCNFDWHGLSPKLFTKTRQLLGLPVVRGRVPTGQGDYPGSFPAYYAKLIPTTGEPTKVALHKLAKLTYFLTIVSPAPNAFGEQGLVKTDPTTLTPVALLSSSPYENVADKMVIPGYNAASLIRQGAADIVAFLQTVRIYLVPSNGGAWTAQLASLLSSLVTELSRHVGRSVAFRLYSADPAVSPFELPLHEGTVRFLCGTLLSIFMEGVYGRNRSMITVCSAGLKELVGIEPSLGEVVVPFLLTGLDASSVNQSHQAPAALGTLAVIAKPLFFPNPVMIKFLPALLRLSLPGIDPSDAYKTSTTLQMFSSVLAWLPLRTNYDPPIKEAYPGPYLSLANLCPESPPSSSPAGASLVVADWHAVDRDYAALASIIKDWVPAFLDRILAVLDSLEAPKKGQPRQPLVSLLADSAGYLFQALDPALRAAAEDKLLEHFRRSSPSSAAKAAGKIFSTMVECNPSVLPKVLGVLLDADVTSLSCSHDKLSFRLKVVAGAVRCAQAEATCAALPLLETVLTPALFFHQEKSVRKAAFKLIKDIIRGATAAYPTHVSPLTGSSPSSSPSPSPSLGRLRIADSVSWEGPTRRRI
jgi:hypothetical protein